MCLVCEYQYTLAKSIVVICLIALGAISCDDQVVEIPAGALEEQMVDISGKWQLEQVWLNDQNVTDRMDFAQLSLILEMNESGPTSYDVEPGPAPFPILEDGSWSYDDLVYPTVLRLENSNKKSVLTFASPPISGNNRFSVSFSLGCPDNIYTYAFRKI